MIMMIMMILMIVMIMVMVIMSQAIVLERSSNYCLVLAFVCHGDANKIQQQKHVPSTYVSHLFVVEIQQKIVLPVTCSVSRWVVSKIPPKNKLRRIPQLGMVHMYTVYTYMDSILGNG